jgi:hypothetical protein
MEIINKLESPDPLSRSTNDDGRRIERIDGGYRIINYLKYREYTYSDNPESVYKREYRDKKKKEETNRTCVGHVQDTLSSVLLNSSSSSSSLKEDYKKKTFQKPTVEQVAAYCKERNNLVDAQAFFDFYESKGWLVGKSPMKNWQAAVRTWEKTSCNYKSQPPQSSQYREI